MMLSVLIPAHNEEGCIEGTLRDLSSTLLSAKISHEILVVNDNSKDRTEVILHKLQEDIPHLRYVNNTLPNGFGFAIRCGIECFKGDVLAIYMADASDKPADLINYYRTMQRENVDCVFGTRWHRSSQVIDYPKLKLVVNRAANIFIQILFGLSYNDTTNAFKMYRREVIEGLGPYLSQHFNLTVEMPLKAIIRGYSYRVVPSGWVNRKHGVSKLQMREMGSRYLFIVLYCLLEKWLSKGDYNRISEGKQSQLLKSSPGN